MEKHRPDRFVNENSGSFGRIPPPPPQRHGRGAGGGHGEFSCGGNRFHPYRAPQSFSAAANSGGGAGRGFRESGGGSPGGFGPPPPSGDPQRGFLGHGGNIGHFDGKGFAKLYIGGVPRTVREEDIRPLFEKYGDIVEVIVVKDKITGEQQGYCFVKYAKIEEANAAIKALHNQYTFPGGPRPIRVRFADSDRGHQGIACDKGHQGIASDRGHQGIGCEREYLGFAGNRGHQGAVEEKLFVASLNIQASNNEVEDIFSPYGHVEDVFIMRDAQGQSRGLGFIKFTNRDAAVAAMNALNGTYMMRGCHRPLVVRFADPRKPKFGEQRGGPTFDAHGFNSRSEATPIIRPTAYLDEPWNQRNHLETLHLSNSESCSPHQLHNHISSIPSYVEGAPTASLDIPGVIAGPSNGSCPGVSAPPSQQGLSPMLTPVHPAGQRSSPLHKSPVPSQSCPPPLQLQQNQHSPLKSQAPMVQFGQLQVPQSGGLTTFNQGLSSQQLPCLCELASSSQQQQSASSAICQAPLNSQQQVVPVINQQHFAGNNATLPSVQQPVQHLLSQLPQAPQQQAHASESSSQSLQLPGGMGSLPSITSTVSGNASAAVPSNATILPATTTSTALLTCNWTEHTAPDGFPYYFNRETWESKWEKPEEYTIFQQKKQQQKLLLFQQQKHSIQQLPSSDLQSHTQVQAILQPQVMQIQGQSQMTRQQGQPHLQQFIHQASSGTPPQNMQDFNCAQLQGGSSVIDPSRVGEGIQAAQ